MTCIIYLINLDERKDRLQESAIQFEKADLEFNRISAEKPKTGIANDFLTPTVEACWRSHLKTYQLFLNTNYEYALILEDDFVFNKKIDFALYIEQMRISSIDLLQIGYLRPGLMNKFRWLFEEIEKSFFGFLYLVSRIKPLHGLSSRMRVHEAGIANSEFTLSSFLPGTHAYIINRQLAKSILDANSFVLSADEFFIALAKMRSHRICRLKFSAISQSNSKPSIEDRFVGWGRE